MPRPIRILHVLTAMDLAGTETLLMNLYRNIDRDVIQFDFAVSSLNECAYDAEILSLGGRLYHYPRYKGINHVSYVAWWKAFFNEHNEYHIVHGHIGSTAAIYLGIAKKAGCFTVAHSHSTKTSISMHSFLYGIYSYPTRYIADYFFGCSKQALIDRYGNRIAFNPGISSVLNNAIDAKRFSFDSNKREIIRQQYGVEEEILVLGTVGRLTTPKNPLETVKICAELKERGVNFVFWWFGEGEMRNEIEQAINDADLQNYVNLLGTRKDINNVLQGMDIFLFPSIWEGLGISCVEAQASGLPTLCSDTIPMDAKVTELCTFLPLNNTDRWCDKIIEISKKISKCDYQRPNTYQCITNNRYDIVAQSKWLQSFYEKHTN